MSRLPFITVCWAFLLAHNFIICLSNGLKEPELNKLIEKNFDAKFSLQPRADIVTAPKYKFTYTRGVRIPGDRLVASAFESRKWPVAQNVTLNLTYPRAGVGSNISYVEIYVTQDTTLGSGRLTDGDIQQRKLSITIEAFKTPQFGHTTYIYGY
ncbi:uncharacterized protein LOC129566534 [Sitodiplosis mosellana]|uniref:uncharacterized protein LOC129566534 n=1 Tax=Sitodiplosis mosellana TaxID=263140 RepID=UPI002443F81B|nr:uncharacterized protein LOC129566534 [Sitodiplosis mosellana]